MSDSGGRPTSASDEEVLRYLQNTDERVVTTPEVAEALNVSRRTALRRLSNLADEGLIERKDIGGRSAVWWMPDDSDPPPTLPEDDPLFTGEPLLEPEDPVDETEIDEILYGEG